MSKSYAVVGGPAPQAAGLAVLRMSSPAGLVAEFVPDAGMVGCSLRHQGEELLGQRGGMSAYLQRGATFGIPLLAPWANRLGDDVYEVAGSTVSVTGVRGVHRDGNGLPLHGLLAAAGGWQVTSATGGAERARIAARLAFTAERAEFPAFPFPHELAVVVELVDATLTITTTVTPTTSQAVPIAFGWHPYFTLPGVPRAQWQVHLPFHTQMELNERSLPTGVRQAVSFADAPLGERTFDDLFADVEPGAMAWVAGGGRRISVTYGEGYPYGVVYAPAGDSLIAIEPMTAPTDPFRPGREVVLAPAGGSYSATFTIKVSEVRT